MNFLLKSITSSEFGLDVCNLSHTCLRWSVLFVVPVFFLFPWLWFVSVQWESSPHGRDCHQKHGWCWPVVPITGDTDGCWDGEEDQGPGQKHKVQEWISSYILTCLLYKSIICVDFQHKGKEECSHKCILCVSGEWGDLQTQPQHGEANSVLLWKPKERESKCQ